MLSEKLLNMPKIDLHCHLDGSLTLECVQDLYEKPVTLQELQVSEDCQNLAEYLEKFDLPLECLQTADGLKKASKAFLCDLTKDQVSYVEVRFAPLLHINKQLSCEQILEAVIEGLEEAKKETGIYYNVIACAMRHHTEEESMEMFKAARKFLGKGLCAVDLAGNEAAFPMKNFEKLFAYARELELPFTIHAGECGSVENVVDSVNAGARRIGHGIALKGNKEAMDLCREKNVGIEMCPISNMQTKAVADPAEYPIREFLDAGLKVTLNTDNRMVSNSTLAKEIEFVQKNYGITDEEIWKMTENAIEVSFANDEVKQMLLKKLNG